MKITASPYTPSSDYHPVSVLIRQYVFHDIRTTLRFGTKFSDPTTMVNGIIGNKHAIGILPFSVAKDLPLKMLAVEGARLSNETIKANEYPVYIPLFLVTGAKVSDNAQLFLDYVVSEDARNILRESDVLPYLDAPHLHTSYLFEGLK